MPNLGGGELLIVLVIILVLFGGAKLPQLARSLGQAKKEFSVGMNDDDDKPSPPVPPAPQGPVSS